MAFLITHGGGSSIQDLISSLRTSKMVSIHAGQKIVSAWKQKLNLILGWEAVQNMQGALRLDAETDWILEEGKEKFMTAKAKISSGKTLN